MRDDDSAPLTFNNEVSGEAPAAPLATWKLLVVDDEEGVHSVTRLVLADFTFDGRGLEFLHAYTGAEAAGLFELHPDIAVALVDVVMESDDAGLRLVRHVRETLGNSFVRLILRTGQPGAAPEREVITRYDINDYKEKAELSSLKLYSAIVAALRGYRDIIDLDRQRRGLERMLGAVALFEVCSVPQFAEVALQKMLMLLESNAASVVSAFYADGLDGREPTGTLLAAVGSQEPLLGQPVAKTSKMVRDMLFSCEGFAYGDQELVLRLESRYGADHYLYANLGRPIDALERSLLELFRHQATSALDNLLLLEKNQTAQHQAIRALAHLARLKEPTTINMWESEGKGGTAQPGWHKELDFVEFLKQLAIQAEVCDWGVEGAVLHLERMSRYARSLAELAQMDQEFCLAIGEAAMLHDIGKIFVQPLTSTSWYESATGKKVAEQHALVGYDFLADFGPNVLPIVTLAQEIVLHHHEAWNGTGFPEGIKGKAIPVAARIVAIVDFFDTCTHSSIKKDEAVTLAANSGSTYGTRVSSERQLRGKDSPAEACQLISAASGYYFDPELARLFLQHWREFAL